MSADHVLGWGRLLWADLPYADPGDGPAASAPFTCREQQVLDLLAEGAGDKMIARQLRISKRTVEKPVGAVLRRTSALSRIAAVVRAMDRRWLTEPGRPTDD